MNWREIWARCLTAEQRSNLRSWGVEVPEPASGALEGVTIKGQGSSSVEEHRALNAGVEGSSPPSPAKRTISPDPREIGRNLEAIARGEVVVGDFTPSSNGPTNVYTGQLRRTRWMYEQDTEQMKVAVKRAVDAALRDAR